MGLFVWIVALLAVLVGLFFMGVFESEQEPPEIKDGWWGRGPQKPDDDTTIRPFKVNVPEAVLTDLKNRLKNVRYGEDLEDVQSFQYGFQVGYMKEVVSYWNAKYDWRKQEKVLNSFPQFKTKIEGIDVHFLRVKPSKTNKDTKVHPLLLIHGWPGSVWEFYKIIPLLTDPQNSDHAFEVICPSIPGYGFSEAPHKKGFDQVAAAQVFMKLMKRLGHDRYYVQGGDWGAVIARIMGQAFPRYVKGVHINMVTFGRKARLMAHQVAAFLAPSLVLSKADQERWLPFGTLFKTLMMETGYFHIQATKPDTVGFSLNDSPVGLAAYILEKFSTWTDPAFKDLKDGGLTKKFTMDEVLTNVMIYWVTGTIASSQRFYKEYVSSDRVPVWDEVYVKVPAGLAMFPNELINMPVAFAEYYFKNITQATHLPRGGHFAAFEEPALLANDVLSFVRKAESSYYS